MSWCLFPVLVFPYPRLLEFAATTMCCHYFPHSLNHYAQTHTHTCIKNPTPCLVCTLVVLLQLSAICSFLGLCLLSFRCPICFCFFKSIMCFCFQEYMQRHMCACDLFHQNMCFACFLHENSMCPSCDLHAVFLQPSSFPRRLSSLSKKTSVPGEYG